MIRLVLTLLASLSLPALALAQETPAERPANRLAGETSPYLLLHAHNPVDWYPWGPEALEKARAENKPIFLSIGYSSCFWCHVMERQTFEDEEVAAFMNEHFVNIKVDREERPDLDDIYMTALQVYFQAIRSPQGGGWPLSMFLTPEGKPLGGGTYFPPRDREGHTGFLTVLQRMHELWTGRNEAMQANAEILSRETRRVMSLAPVPADTPVSLEATLVDTAVEAVTAEYDPEHGGLDFNPQQPGGPKFPVPSRLMLLQSQIKTAGDPQLSEMVANTLERMRRGGIHDHLGGGFHRYSTDRRWLVPHFEKMLYDNAQLAGVYVEAARRTGRDEYRETAGGIFEFVLREMTDAGGGFYSALDAETDGVEGQYYVWSKEEIAGVLGDEDAGVFCEVYGLNEPQVFEHGYVLHLPRPVEESAEKLGVDTAELQERLVRMRAKLLAARVQREPLLRDEKILTSWNGLMIGALARAAEVLERPELVDAAGRAADFLLSRVVNDDGRLLRTHTAGVSSLNAYLDDYAFLSAGLLDLHAATGDEKWLRAARRLTDDQIDLFWDEQDGGFFFTADDHEELLARTRNAYDSVLPSGNSVSVRNLVRLAEHTGEERYRTLARETLQVFALRLQQSPASMAYMALALDEHLSSIAPGATSGASDDSQTADPSVEQASDPSRQPVAPESVVANRPLSTEEDEEPLIVAARTNPRDREARVAAKAYLSVNHLPAGGTAKVAVVLSIRDGWHINANPARPDFLIPTGLTAEAALKSRLSRVAYPRGESFRMPGFDEPLSVYEGEVMLVGTLDVPAAAAGRTEKVDLTVKYQACNDRQCLPPDEFTLTIRVPVATGGQVQPINRRLFQPPRRNGG